MQTDDLKDFFRDRKISQKEIAERLNVTQPTVSALLNGKPFGKRTAKAWEDAFGISAMWLMTGNGEMLKDAHISDSAIMFGDSNTYTKTDRELIELLKNKDRQIDELIFLLKQQANNKNNSK